MFDFQLQYEDSGSDFCDEEYLGKSGPIVDRRASVDHVDLSRIFFSNEEYYSKLEELKKAHLRTMAQLESMYRRKLQLKATETLDTAAAEAAHRWAGVSFVQGYWTDVCLCISCIVYDQLQNPEKQQIMVGMA